MSILLTKGNIDDVFKVLDNHNINSALMLDTKLKVNEIIFKKYVDIEYLSKCNNVKEYNAHWCYEIFYLTPEEFELLKRWVG